MYYYYHIITYPVTHLILCGVRLFPFKVQNWKLTASEWLSLDSSLPLTIPKLTLMYSVPPTQ